MSDHLREKDKCTIEWCIGYTTGRIECSTGSLEDIVVAFRSALYGLGYVSETIEEWVPAPGTDVYSDEEVTQALREQKEYLLSLVKDPAIRTMLEELWRSEI